MDITWYLYEPLGWQVTVGYRVDAEKCRASVPVGGRSPLFRQCRKSPVAQIQGYGFCKGHGEKIQKAIDRERAARGET